MTLKSRMGTGWQKCPVTRLLCCCTRNEALLCSVWEPNVQLHELSFHTSVYIIHESRYITSMFLRKYRSVMAVTPNPLAAFLRCHMHVLTVALYF